MFCPKCGTKLPDDAKFCGSCGHQIAQPAAATNPTTTAPFTTNTYTATPSGLVGRLIPDGLPGSINDLLTSKGFQQVSKPLAILLTAILALAFFMPAVSAGALGFNISFSVKDATFGLSSLNSFTGSGGGYMALIVALLVPLAALACTILLKKDRIIWVVNVVVGAFLFCAALSVIASIQNSSYSDYITVGIGVWLYLVLGLGLAVLSGFMLYKLAKK